MGVVGNESDVTYIRSVIQATAEIKCSKAKLVLSVNTKTVLVNKLLFSIICTYLSKYHHILVDNIIRHTCSFVFSEKKVV